MTKSSQTISRQRIADTFALLTSVLQRTLDTQTDNIVAAGTLVRQALLSGQRVLACGNGGSAADAQHFVAEIVGRMSVQRKALPALSLTSDPSIVSAVSNDYGYHDVFARQVEAWGTPGDVLVGISTSGASSNVLAALRVAWAQDMRSVVLAGRGGDPTLQRADVCIHVPEDNTQRVQEVHGLILHLICAEVEAAFIEHLSA